MKSELQKAIDGELFNAIDPEIQQITIRTKRLLRQLNDCDYADARGNVGLSNSCLALLAKEYILM